MIENLFVPLSMLLAAGAATAAPPTAAATPQPLYVAKRLQGPAPSPAAAMVPLTGNKLADVSGLPDPPRAGVRGDPRRLLTGVPMVVAKQLR